MNKKTLVAVILVCCLVVVAGALWLLLGDDSTPSEAETTLPTMSETLDESKQTVNITLPSLFFDSSSPATDKLTPEQLESGYQKAVVNSDGSVTYTITKTGWRQLLTEMKKTVSDSFDAFLGSSQGGYKSVDKILHNDNFSDVKVYVDRAKYEGSTDTQIGVSIYATSFYYQIFAGGDSIGIKCTVTVIDSATNAEISSTVYPDALN